MTGNLTDRRIAVAESRELDLLADMLAREGAHTVRYPLVAIEDAPDSRPVEAWIRRVIAGDCHDVIFYTGEGLRRLVGFAERAALREPFIAALQHVRKIARGPKPVRALRELGLSPDLTTRVPTTEGIIDLLKDEVLSGRAVGVQVYGQEPNAVLLAYLAACGAKVDAVAPYVYASEIADSQVEALIRELADGRVSAIVITSSPQIVRLFEVADKTGLVAQLRDGLSRTKVAAMGPVVAAELERHGIHPDVMPEHSFTMKPLVQALARLLAVPENADGR